MSNPERYIERQLGEITAERDRLRDALQSIADYRPSRQGTEAFLLIAHHCQTTARNALAAHEGGIGT